MNGEQPHWMKPCIGTSSNKHSIKHIEKIIQGHFHEINKNNMNGNTHTEKSFCTPACL
jgi:UDP-2,3-diacylglucosamine pyrophosphatase LpxH